MRNLDLSRSALPATKKCGKVCMFPTLRQVPISRSVLLLPTVTIKLPHKPHCLTWNSRPKGSNRD